MGPKLRPFIRKIGLSLKVLTITQQLARLFGKRTTAIT